MAKFIIISCLAALLAVCEAGFIPSPHTYSHFPNLQTVHHGHGATSYQNVQVQNFGSVPIPKELQVDDGHEHLHSQYLHEEIGNSHEFPSFAQPEVALNHIVVSTEASYGGEHAELSHHYTPHLYDHQAEYEYH